MSQLLAECALVAAEAAIVTWLYLYGGEAIDALHRALLTLLGGS
jgi:hypothetical protein